MDRNTSVNSVTPAPGIAAEGLVVRYPGASEPAIDGLSIEVPAGEFHAILGPSGCGKSTLLKVLAGIIKASAGSATAGRRHDIAYVPQGNSCFPWMSAQDNVAYGLWTRGVGKQKRREVARNLLHRMGLDGIASDYPHQLSEGMRQRVAIARAFALGAPVLLMDEPFSALDFQTKIRIQEELLALWRDSNATVLYVTHDIDEALTLASRVAVLSERPATVRDAFDVPFPRPRSYRHIRAEPGYAALFSRCFDLLEPAGAAP